MLKISNFICECLDFILEFIFFRDEYWDRHPKTGKERKLSFFHWRYLKYRTAYAWRHRDFRIFMQNRENYLKKLKNRREILFYWRNIV
jgi:hypothetical protein